MLSMIWRWNAMKTRMSGVVASTLVTSVRPYSV
jgi:hypothetical protein